MGLEKMESFFEKRLEDYEEHMLENVEGCREGFIGWPSLSLQIQDIF